MYDLTMFFWELRLLCSTILLVTLWYKLRFIDEIFKYLFELDARRVTKLPVTIGNVIFSVSGYAILENVEVHSPPIEVDDRWHIETIVSVSCVYVEFPLLVAMFYHICSMQQLMVFDSIHVTGLKFFAEGFLGPNDVMQYNLDLIGGKRDLAVIEFYEKQRKAQEAIETLRKERKEASLRAKEEARVAKLRKFNEKFGFSAPTQSTDPDRVIDPQHVENSGTCDSVAVDVVFQRTCSECDLGLLHSVSSDSADREVTNLSAVVVCPVDVVEAPDCMNSFPTQVGPVDNSFSSFVSQMVGDLSKILPPSTNILSTASAASATNAADSVTVSSIETPNSFSFDRLINKASTALKEVQQDISSHNEKVDLFWKSKVAGLHSAVQEWRSDMDELHCAVNQKGILNVASERFSEALAKTKQTIEHSIDDNIVALHIKQNGPEPEVDSSEPRLICRLLKFNTIEVYMYRALPIQLRHLEKKPLVVDSLTLTHIGFQGLQFHSAPIHQRSGSISEGKTAFPAHPTNTVMSPSSRGNEAGTYVSCAAVTNSPIPEDEPSCTNFLDLHNLSFDVCIATSARERFVSPVLSSVDHQRDDRGVYEGAPPAAQESDPRVHDLVISSVDISKSGLDVNILKYRFERLMLLDICKSNAGRLLMDVFDVSAWVSSAHNGFAQQVNKEVLTKTQQEQQELLADAVGKNATVSLNAQKSSVAGSASSAQKTRRLKALSEDGVVESHPIFFD